MLILVLALGSLAGCGDNTVIDGTKFGTYGFLNEGTMRNPSVEYRIIYGNIFWSVVLCETIVAPIYFIGFSLYEPVSKKGADFVPGRVL